LIALVGERVTLAYDVSCAPVLVRESATGDCEIGGTVHVATESKAVDLPLTLHLTPKTRTYDATLPADLLKTGTTLTYWASIQDPKSGLTAVVPAGGAGAPQSLAVVSGAVGVTLPGTFDTPRAIDQVVATGRWGAGSEQLGLSPHDQAATVGPSAFDIESDGTVDVLDEVNSRIARFGAAGARSNIPISMPPVRSDFALEPDGTYDVLEEVGVVHGPELVRFNASGKQLSDQFVPGETATSVRASATGPVVFALPSEEWLPALTSSHTPTSSTAMASNGSSARPTKAGAPALTVKVLPSEVRIMESVHGAATTVWRLTSDTTLGEYQLAHLDGQDLLVVVRQYDDEQSQFRVIKVSPTGKVISNFVARPQEYAETSPQSEFRVGPNGDLYQAVSTSQQFSVVRYVLGGE
jgi:hypothetical protein